MHDLKLNKPKYMNTLTLGMAFENEFVIWMPSVWYALVKFPEI